MAADKKSLGRNDPCHCGSGRKYKQCCLAKDEAAEREARAKSAEAETTEAGTADTAAPAAQPKPSTRQPWKRGQTDTRGFTRVNVPRRSGGS